MATTVVAPARHPDAQPDFNPDIRARRCGLGDRCTCVFGPDRVDEVAGPDRQRRLALAVVDLQPALCDQHAEVGALPPVVAGPVDAQEEGLPFVLQLVPVQRGPAEHQPAAGVERVLPCAGRGREPLHDVVGLLHHHLAPHIGGRQLLPALVDLVDVEVEIDVHVFEDVEQKQRHIGVGARGDVGDRRGPADPRVELAEVHLVGIGVDENVDLEEPPVALLGQAISESAHQLRCGSPTFTGKDFGEHLVATPAAAGRGQPLVADQLGHERADDRAAPSEHRLDRHRAVVDAAHHLDLLADDVGAVLAPVGLRRDEERGLAGVAVWRLDDEFVTETGLFGHASQARPVVDAGQHVRHAWRAGLVAQLGGDDLGVQVLAQAGGGQDQVVAQLLADVLGFAVEEHHRDLGPHAARSGGVDVGPHLGVGQQPVVDLLAALELAGRACRRA